MTQYRQLTRGELTDFDREAKDMILDAMQAGVLGNISKRSHAILRNATGHTVAIPRRMTSPNRSAQNSRADYKRFMRAHTEFIEAHRPPTEQTVETEAPLPEVTPELQETDLWFCNLCNAYAGQDQQTHLQEVHPHHTICEECGKAVKKQGIYLHRRMAHSMTPEDRRANYEKGKAKRAATVARKKAEAQKAKEKAKEKARLIAEMEPEPIEAAEEPTTPEPAPADQVVDRLAEANETLNMIRSVLGKDPRVAELEQQIVVLTEERDAAIKHNQDLEAKLALLREAFDA